MKRLRIPPPLVLIASLLAVTAVSLAATTPRISRSVIGGGGGSVAHSPVRVTATVGQSTVYTLVVDESHPVVLRSGFWQPIAYLSDVPPEQIPQRPQLIGAAPNPFNPMTVIRFAVGAEARDARLRIYDLQGRLVRTLVDEVVSPGVQRAVWQGETDCGDQTASGVYFYRLEVGHEVFTRKILLLK